MSTELTFPQVSLSLSQALDELAYHFKELEKSSHDLYDDVVNRLMVTWENLPEVIANYKISIQNMPKELRERSFIKQSLIDIESIETDLKSLVERFQKNSQESFKAFLDNKFKDYSLESFYKKIDHLNAQIDEMENHPLMKKFLRGEKVLSSKTRIQWARKIGHMLIGPFFVYLFYYSGLSNEIIWTVTGVFLAWAYSLELLRHLNPKVNEWVCKVFRPVMREAEKNRVNSSIFFITASLLIYLTCPMEVTVLSILFLSFGDAIGGIVGVKWGKTKIKKHVSLQGVIACMITCSTISGVMAGWIFDKNLSGFSLIVFSLMGGMIGAYAETLLKKIDDNLIMPIISAPFLWVLMSLFSIL